MLIIDVNLQLKQLLIKIIILKIKGIFRINNNISIYSYNKIAIIQIQPMYKV